MSWETVRKNFSAQHHIAYEGLRFVAEKQPDAPPRVYHFDQQMRLLDAGALREVMGTAPFDQDAYKRLEKHADLSNLPGEVVFGAGDEGIGRKAAQVATDGGLRLTQADWFAGFVSSCFQGFGTNHYSEDGVICNVTDQGLTPDHQQRFLDPLVEIKALRYNRNLTNRNLLVVQFKDEVLDYRRDLAPFFMRALVY